MQENLNSTNILTARFEPDNSESFAFLVTLQAQGLRKKKCYIHICFADAISGKPLRIVSENEYSQFANGNSEICVSAIVKREVFSGRAMRINVPYEVFPELAPGSRITAKVSLVVGEDDAETAGESFDLMVNLGKKFTIYTLEKHIKYVKSTATEAEKIAFAKDLLKNKLDGDAFAALLDLLDDLACSENAVAQYELYHIYKDEKQGVFDAVTAVSWLKKAAENAYPPAVQEIENTQNIEEIEKTGYKNSMDLYRKAAEEGNADAQFTMCEYLSRPGEYYDQEQAAVWLKTAAENGSEAAVKRLSEYFSDAYVSEASVGEYLDIVEKAAQKNCAQAQLALFDAYFTGCCMGREVKIDKKYAADFLLSAANSGCAEACYKIWSLYVGGNDMLMDEPTAVEWLKKAADNTVPAALNDLGDLYIEGKSIEKNNQKGIECILKAAKLENPEAQMRVLSMYRDGRYRDVLIEQDIEWAFESLLGYAKGGNPLAQLTLWVLYQEGNDLLITRQEAIGWLAQADSQGYDPATYELAHVYLNGEYTDVNTEMACSLLEKAAKHGEIRAQFALYQLYYTGEYYALKTDVNKERSYKWLTLSAESYPLAQYQMWVLYNNGNEMDLDSGEALRYLFEAVKNQSPAGIYELGVLYIKGDLVPKNVEKGIAFLEQSKKLRYPKAIYTLSKIKAEGACGDEPVDQDEAEALRLLKLSAEFGYAPACFEIWEHYSLKEGFPIEETWAKKLLESAASQGYQPAVKALNSPKEAS